MTRFLCFISSPLDRQWPRVQLQLDIGPIEVGHLITNLIGLCQVTAAVILCFGDFTKVLWYICLGAETDSSSDQCLLFMMNYIQGKVKIMGAPKCQLQVLAEWRMRILLQPGFISCWDTCPQGAELILVIQHFELNMRMYFFYKMTTPK